MALSICRFTGQLWMSGFDQKYWSIDFAPNPADPKGAGIVFRNHPEGARLVASFIRHEWLERPGATMSLSEAYEKWKAAQNPG